MYAYCLGVSPFELQSLWNPFRDWNLVSFALWIFTLSWSFKASETLLGIETFNLILSMMVIVLQSLWNPFRDWNRWTAFLLQIPSKLQSLWNPFRDWNGIISEMFKSVSWSFKASETLLGIETQLQQLQVRLQLLQSLWNPFRDWNLITNLFCLSVTIPSKPLKPF